jgi:hypothetical protein
VSKERGETVVERIEDILGRAPEIARAGVVHWEHPLLLYPRHCIVLVEGKFDFDALDRVKSTLVAADRVIFTYLGKVGERDGATGGKEHLREYVLSNLPAIRARFEAAPVVVLFDWDAEALAKGLAAKTKGVGGLHIEYWPVSDLNPELGPDFTGIERALGTSLVRKAAAEAKVTLFEREQKAAFHPRDGQTLKQAIIRHVRANIDLEDLKYVKSFIDRLIVRSLGLSEQTLLI